MSNKTKNNTDRLLKLSLEKGRLMMSGGSHRCSICNSVDNESIETNIGDYRSNISFTYDPKDHSHFICIDCSEVIEDVRQDYSYMDEDRNEV